MYFTHSSTFHFILIYSYTTRMNISIDILQFINCFQEQLVEASPQLSAVAEILTWSSVGLIV